MFIGASGAKPFIPPSSLQMMPTVLSIALGVGIHLGRSWVIPSNYLEVSLLSDFWLSSFNCTARWAPPAAGGHGASRSASKEVAVQDDLGLGKRKSKPKQTA